MGAISDNQIENNDLPIKPTGGWSNWETWQAYNALVNNGHTKNHKSSPLKLQDFWLNTLGTKNQDIDSNKINFIEIFEGL